MHYAVALTSSQSSFYHRIAYSFYHDFTFTFIYDDPVYFVIFNCIEEAINAEWWIWARVTVKNTPDFIYYLVSFFFFIVITIHFCCCCCKILSKYREIEAQSRSKMRMYIHIYRRLSVHSYQQQTTIPKTSHQSFDSISYLLEENNKLC